MEPYRLETQLHGEVYQQQVFDEDVDFVKLVIDVGLRNGRDNLRLIDNETQEVVYPR